MSTGKGKAAKKTPVSKDKKKAVEEEKSGDEEFSIIIGQQDIAGRGSKSSDKKKKDDISDDEGEEGGVRHYSVAEDLKIYDLFKAVEGTDKHKTIPGMDGRRKQLAADLKRSEDSMRDRYKRFLKHLTKSELTTIKNVSSEDPDKFYIYFEKVANSKARKFKDVLRGQPHKIREMKDKLLKGEKPKKSLERKTEGKDEGDGRKKGVKRNSDAAGVDKHSPGRGRKAIEEEDPLEFEILDHIPDEYIKLGHPTLKRIRPNAAVVYETDKYNALLRGLPTSVQVSYNGDDFKFKFIGRQDFKTSPSFKGVMDSLSELLNITEAEAQEVFEALSCDVDEVKAYIGGNTRALWKPIDDEVLRIYVESGGEGNVFYDKLVADKGIKAVNRRIQFLRERQ